MAAVWLKLRSEMRRHWPATVALVVLVGLTGGIALAALAGARRTDTAYERLLADVDYFDVLVNPDDSESELDFDAVAALPGVEVVGSVAGMLVGFPDEAGELDLAIDHLTLAPADDRAFRALGRPKVVEGRLPDSDRPEEILITRGLAADLDLRPGDTVDLLTVSLVDVAAWEEAGATGSPPSQRVTFSVVGVGFTTDEIVVDEGFASELVLLSEAFYRDHVQDVFFRALQVRLAGGAADVPAFREAVLAMVPDEAIEFQSQEVVSDGVRRAVRPLVVALAIFAGLVALAGVLVLGQALARQLAADAGDGPALHAVGMTRRQLFAVALLRATAVAVAGALVAVVTAVVLSPFTPIGPARTAEPDRGIDANVSVLAAGAAGLAVLLVVAIVVPAWRASGWRTSGAARQAAAERPSRLGDVLSGAGASPTVVAGVRMALEPGRGRTAVPVRSTLVGVALAVAAVVAAVTFGAGLGRLIDTPDLYGWAWDARVEFEGEDEAGQAGALAASIDALTDAEWVTGANVLQADRVDLDGRPVPAVGIEVVRGGPLFTIAEGRAPADDDEIALGSRTLDRLGLVIGDPVTAGSAGTARSLRIVGQAVFPGLGTYSGSDRTELGVGALVPLATLEAVGAGFDFRSLVVDVTPGTDAEQALGEVARGAAGVEDAAGVQIAARPQRPGDVANLDRVRQMPLVLAGVLAALAVAALAHALVTSVRRRRHDLAVLKTLGFTRHQVSGTVAWQATVTTGIALIVGVPVGVAVGRWAWATLADQLGIGPEPVTPVLFLVLAVPLAVLLANVLAAVPARAAGRTPAAVALRVE